MIRNRLFLFFLTIFMLSGCCLNDYRKEINEIMIPMNNELKQFYNNNNRYPSLKERNDMLEKSGCHIVNNKCRFSGSSFLLTSNINIRGEYDLEIKLGSSRCYTGLFVSGNLKNASCDQDNCVELKQ